MFQSLGEDQRPGRTRAPGKCIASAPQTFGESCWRASSPRSIILTQDSKSPGIRPIEIAIVISNECFGAWIFDHQRRGDRQGFAQSIRDTDWSNVDYSIAVGRN